ncbi:BQ2448_553 [Microbotryum intermedium]|uniref:BQ2448_553 protein n=1 Tax=Microbotryum intermedium TaxID=269621 RepID=A0A238F2R6_9BASI|nr:BQ2448_553 [Microbotryum intermedium]
MITAPGRHFLLLATTLLLVQLAAATSKPRKHHLNRLQVFGDALSDDGKRTWNLTNHTWPANRNYYQHRFTNGFTHTEILAQHLGFRLNSSAIAGATTNNKLVQGFTGPRNKTPVPSILDQVARFIDPPASDFPPDSGDDITRPPIDRILFVIYAGANDALLGKKKDVSAKQVAKQIQTSIKTLKAVGGVYFLLPTVPPLNRSNRLNKHSYLSNYLKDLRREIVNIGRKDPNVVVADVYGLFQKINSDPSKYDYTNLLAPCLAGVYGTGSKVTLCQKPDDYLYFDSYNPGSRGQDMMAEVEYNALKKEGWVR